MLGKGAHMEKVHGTSRSAMGRNHGASTYWSAVSNTSNDYTTVVPNEQYFSEGNGGEFRKSFHGYPAGYAQLVESPTTFMVRK